MKIFYKKLLLLFSLIAVFKAYSGFLIVPLVKKTPKFGTSLGLLSGFMYKFDEESQYSSMFAFVNRSSTNSYSYGLATNNLFMEERHKLMALVVNAKVNNTYDNFLGIAPAELTDNFSAYGLRYAYRVYDRWYVGPQFFLVNYNMSSVNAIKPARESLAFNAAEAGGSSKDVANKIIDDLGKVNVTVKSNSVGYLLQYNSKDNNQMPSDGIFFEFQQRFSREALGSSSNYHFSSFVGSMYKDFGTSHVTAFQLRGLFASDAVPLAIYPSIKLRGYTPGEQKAKNNLAFQLEERFFISDSFRLTLFSGVTCLFKSLSECKKSNNLYPMAGTGFQYVLNKDEKMAIRLDYAIGKFGSGVYLQLGQAF